MDQEIISKNILNLRKSLHLTQAEFAKKLPYFNNHDFLSLIFNDRLLRFCSEIIFNK